MRTKHKLQSPKKPVYFLASVALHTLLVGLFIYFYSNFFYSPRQEQTKAEEETLEVLENPALSEMSPTTLSPPEDDTRALPRLDPGQEFPEQEAIPAPETDRFNESLESYLTAEEPTRAAPIPVPESPAQAETPLQREPISPPIQSGIGIIRAQLTTGIKQHEPIDQVGPVVQAKKDGVKRLFYFTEVKDMKGKTIIHRWEYEGHILAEVPLSIDSYQWRTYSSKDLTPTMTGHWQIVVVDAEEGQPLHTDSFMYK